MPNETIEDLGARLLRYEDHFRTLYGEMETAKEFYDLKFSFDKPDELTYSFIPPTAHTSVDDAANELITENPRVRRRREGHNEAQEHDDDGIEAALQAFLLDVEEYLQSPVLHEAGKLQIGRGGVALVGPLWNMKSERVWFEAYDFLTVLPEPGPEPREVFLRLEMTVAEFEQLAARDARFQEFDRESRKETDKVKFVQWYSYEPGESNGRYAAWIEGGGEFLKKPGPSGYPYLPVELIPSGWGQATVGVSPEDTYVSLLDTGEQSLLRAEAQMLTMLQSHAAEKVWERYRVPPGTQIPKDFQLSRVPGSISYIPEVMQPFESPELSQAVEAHFLRVSGLLERHLVSPILSDQRPAGVTTATQHAMLTGRARRRFRPPVRLLQSGVARLLVKVGLLLRLATEIFGESFFFEWRGAKLFNKMYRDDYTVEVELLAADEEEQRVRVAEGTALDGKLPRRHIWENYYGIENFSAAYEDWQFEQIVESDEWRQSVNQVFQQVVMEKERKGQQGGTQTPQPLEALARLFRAARPGFAPAQPGTVEGLAGQVAAPRMLPQ